MWPWLVSTYFLPDRAKLFSVLPIQCAIAAPARRPRIGNAALVAGKGTAQATDREGDWHLQLIFEEYLEQTSL